MATLATSREDFPAKLERLSCGERTVYEAFRDFKARNGSDQAASVFDIAEMTKLHAGVVVMVTMELWERGYLQPWSKKAISSTSFGRTYVAIVYDPSQLPPPAPEPDPVDDFFQDSRLSGVTTKRREF